MATTLEQLRQRHPQQAEVDAESARMLRAPVPCDICGGFAVYPSEFLIDMHVCGECFEIAQRILRRLVRQELGLGGE